MGVINERFLWTRRAIADREKQARRLFPRTACLFLDEEICGCEADDFAHGATHATVA